MKTGVFSRLSYLGAIAVAITIATSPGRAALYDLNADWSDGANPNGPWSYNQGASLLPHVDQWQGLSGDFTSGQPAWARVPVGNSNLPCWFKSSGTVGIAHDWQTGDIVTHTTDDFNGVGSGPANVTWTSPGDGTINISGAVWMGRDIGRGNHWTLSHNGAALSAGDIFSGDTYSRANPFDFATGSGGPAALTNVPVAAGDMIKLQLDRTSADGDYAGVNFTIEFVVPFQPRITAVNQVSNDLFLTFTTQSGKAYAIQGSANLLSGAWATIPGTSNSATTNLLQSTITNAFTQPQQFYRVWQQP